MTAGSFHNSLSDSLAKKPGLPVSTLSSVAWKVNSCNPKGNIPVGVTGSQSLAGLGTARKNRLESGAEHWKPEFIWRSFFLTAGKLKKIFHKLDHYDCCTLQKPSCWEAEYHLVLLLMQTGFVRLRLSPTHTLTRTASSREAKLY